MKSYQYHGFAFLQDILDQNSSVSAVLGTSNAIFQIPNRRGLQRCRGPIRQRRGQTGRNSAPTPRAAVPRMPGRATGTDRPLFAGWGCAMAGPVLKRREKLANHPGGRLGFHAKRGRVTRQMARTRGRSSGCPENPKHWRISILFYLLTGSCRMSYKSH